MASMSDLRFVYTTCLTTLILSDVKRSKTMKCNVVYVSFVCIEHLLISVLLGKLHEQIPPCDRTLKRFLLFSRASFLFITQP